MLDPVICQQARLSRDKRFDGLFFIGVKTTGIFCRPVCPAPSPKEHNILYYSSALEASTAGFRPCIRCRPEAAPGSPAWQGTATTVQRALRLIEEGFLNHASVSALADRLGISDRYLRKLFKEQLGTTPIAMANSHKVLFAKQLLNDSSLSITDIAFASGFNSLRQFNTAFKSFFSKSPGQLRKTLHRKTNKNKSCFQQCRLILHYRPPYCWQSMLAFYQQRCIPGLETVSGDYYRRSIQEHGHNGFIEITQTKNIDALELNICLDSLKNLIFIKEKVRRMFDLNANMQQIHKILSKHTLLKSIIKQLPGLRLPGAWCPFEIAIRAIVSQQISVKAARTILGRITERFGTRLNTLTNEEIHYLFPSAETLSQADLNGIGIPQKKQITIRAFCTALTNGKIQLDNQTNPEHLISQLCELPGIGQWTANYIAMRGLSMPDAFPHGDLGLIKALQSNSDKECIIIAENWRPWRAYAAILLWQSLTPPLALPFSGEGIKSLPCEGGG